MPNAIADSWVHNTKQIDLSVAEVESRLVECPFLPSSGTWQCRRNWFMQGLDIDRDHLNLPILTNTSLMALLPPSVGPCVRRFVLRNVNPFPLPFPLPIIDAR